MRFPLGEFVGVCSGISGVVVGSLVKLTSLETPLGCKSYTVEPCNVETTCAEIRSIVDVQMMQSY